MFNERFGGGAEFAEIRFSMNPIITAAIITACGAVAGAFVNSLLGRSDKTIKGLYLGYGALTQGLVRGTFEIQKSKEALR